MIKRLGIFLLCICLMFSLSSCGSKEENIEKSKKETNSFDNGIEKGSNKTSETESKSNETDTSTTQIVQETTSSHIHSYSEATCTSAKQCECGEKIGEPLGHQLSPATCTSPAICVRCGTASGNSLGHNYLNVTCIAPKTCNVCGSTSGEALGHTYSAATCVLAQQCTVCDETYGSPLGHNYVNYICSRCNQTDPDSKIALYDMNVFDYEGHCYAESQNTDTYGNTYYNTIRIGQYEHIYGSTIPFIKYHTNYQYNRFKGTISYYDGYNTKGSMTFTIYKDDSIAYTKSNITKESEPFQFDIDISNCNFIKIVVYDSIGAGGYAYLILSDAYFIK